MEQVKDKVNDLDPNQYKTYLEDMEQFLECLEKIKVRLNETMGGEKSFCFLKAPSCFLEQISEGVDMFLFNAHTKLMKKIKNQLFFA